MRPGRNPEITRNSLMDMGFQLYSSRTIEDVSYQQIADATGISMASIFRHFPHKCDLVIAIATKKWNEFCEMIFANRSKNSLYNRSAAERMEFFLDCIIRLYETQPELLRFNAGFDAYVIKENLSEEQMQSYYDAIEPFRERFGWLYERAQLDGTIRTDVSEDQLFFATLYAMLSAAGRYACGTIWPKKSHEDCLEALKVLKLMIMDYCQPAPVQEAKPAAKRNRKKSSENS